MNNLDLFNKNNPDHMLHDEYIESVKAKRKARIAKIIGCFIGLLAARYLWN